MKQFALITGASQGLGKCFALELARQKINTILVSLPGEKLEKVSEACKELGVDSYYFETDLRKNKNIVKLGDWINHNFNVDILINNAGIGGTMSFTDSSLDSVNSMIQLNIKAPTLLTHILLPNLTRSKSSYILNVSSIASFCPLGYKAVYSSSKKYIQHFSLALRQELIKHGVWLCILFPGPIPTNASVKERINSYGFMSKLIVLEPEIIAKIALRRMFKKKKIIIPGLLIRIIYGLTSLVPYCIRIPLLSRMVSREIQLNHPAANFSINVQEKKAVVNIRS